MIRTGGATRPRRPAAAQVNVGVAVTVEQRLLVATRAEVVRQFDQHVAEVVAHLRAGTLTLEQAERRLTGAARIGRDELLRLGEAPGGAIAPRPSTSRRSPSARRADGSPNRQDSCPFPRDVRRVCGPIRRLARSDPVEGNVVALKGLVRSDIHDRQAVLDPPVAVQPGADEGERVVDLVWRDEFDIRFVLPAAVESLGPR
jgi:hypothetical protein